MPHQQLAPAVTVRRSPATGEWCISMKVLQIFLSGHTQDHPGLPPGLVALSGSVFGRSSHGLQVEFLSYRAESGAVLNPLNLCVQFS